MIHVFTSSVGNYQPKVTVLCESVRQYLPEAKVHWLVVDEPGGDPPPALPSGLVDDVIFVTDLDVGRRRSWLFQHSVIELSTAVKPSAALRCLDEPGCEVLLYIDPDIVLFSRLDDLLEEMAGSSIALTPHQLKPETDAAMVFHEVDSLRYGLYNLGFLGVRNCPEARRFLRWWENRCWVSCEGDWREGLFTDQKWVNFAPLFFEDVAILRNPRFNVAPWNLSQRELRGTFDEGFTVDGQPLGFYHFTGFDTGAHLAHVAGLKGDTRPARMLIDWYAHRTRALDEGPPRRWRLGHFSNGEPITDAHRRAYRSRPELRERFPDPYLVVPGRRCFLGWFRSEPERGPAEPRQRPGAD